MGNTKVLCSSGLWSVDPGEVSCTEGAALVTGGWDPNGFTSFMAVYLPEGKGLRLNFMPRYMYGHRALYTGKILVMCHSIKEVLNPPYKCYKLTKPNRKGSSEFVISIDVPRCAWQILGSIIMHKFNKNCLHNIVDFIPLSYSDLGMIDESFMKTLYLRLMPQNTTAQCSVKVSISEVFLLGGYSKVNAYILNLETGQLTRLEDPPTKASVDYSKNLICPV